MRSMSLLEPIWLGLLLLLPILAWQSRRSLAGLGPIRGPLSLFARFTVVTMLVLAIAGLSSLQHSDRQCVLFVLDHSLSMPAGSDDNRAELALQRVVSTVARRERMDDLAGLVVFGKDARIELPPTEYPRHFRWPGIGSEVERQHTDVGAGLKLAIGAFPPNCSRRMVLISDGSQNRGNALAQAISAVDNKIPIDVVPIDRRGQDDVLVERILLPPEVKRGETITPRIVLKSTRATRGRVRLTRRANGKSEMVVEQPVELTAGSNVLTLKETLDFPDFFTYDANFVADDPQIDRQPRNNQVSGFTWVRGQGNVLLVEPNPGDHQLLTETLRRDNLSVTTRMPTELGNSLAELRRYDLVILANVPADSLGTLAQDRIAAATRDLGIGLIMIGGPDSFGAGGYRGSALEKALPVDMDIKSAQVSGKGALVLIMHASEMAEGNFWQKEIAKLAVKALGSLDECGLVYFGATVSWLFPLQPVGDGALLLRRIDRMAPGDMPDFDAAMKLALKPLVQSNAMNKHVIIVSDGDPLPPSAQVLNDFVANRITCSTVGVSTHGPAEQQRLKQIADATGGRSYSPQSAKLLPQIYIKETRVVTRSLVYEPTPPIAPQQSAPHPALAGLGETLPLVGGFVLTTPKSAAEVALVSLKPADVGVLPILATWQFGLGKSVAVTTDAGRWPRENGPVPSSSAPIWAADWTQGDTYARFWRQLARWTMRSAESDNLAIAVQEEDGQAKVTVHAFDKVREALDLLKLTGTAVAPDGAAINLPFRQTEPGRYEAKFPVESTGAYFVSAQIENGKGFVSTGFNVSYPAEFRDVETNRTLLENIASVSGGAIIEWPDFDRYDPFAHRGEASTAVREVWPELLVATLFAFLFDVAIRRIAFTPADLKQAARRAWSALRRQPAPVESTTFERLRSAKTQSQQAYKSEREYQPPSPSSFPPPSDILERVKPADGSKDMTTVKDPPAEATDNDSYTARLLKAKRQVWNDPNAKNE